MSDNNNMLQSYTNTIKRYEKEIKTSYMYIGMNLQEIQKNNMFEDTKYKNIKEYAYDEFGYEAAKTYYLIQIYEKFFEEEIKIKRGILTYGDYTISQLRYMLNMNDEQLKKCKSSMTVKEIKELLIEKSTRVDNVSIENTELIKNNNVIEGVFTEKKEEKVPEEKVTTIIVTELPREPISENKTITVNVKTEQNDDYVIKQEIVPEFQEDYYKKKYHEALEEIQVLQQNIGNESQKVQHYQNKFKEQQEILRYVSDKLNKICSEFYNEQIQYLYADTRNYLDNGLLPKKVHFMKNVI